MWITDRLIHIYSNIRDVLSHFNRLNNVKQCPRTSFYQSNSINVEKHCFTSAMGFVIVFTHEIVTFKLKNDDSSLVEFESQETFSLTWKHVRNEKFSDKTIQVNYR